MISQRRRARAVFLGSAAAAAIALAAPHGAWAGSAALPTGGAVQSGQATIAASGANALTISQSSKSAIINWSSFSIGQGGSVQFNNGSGATLNRVLSGGPISTIDGRLSATGSVYLINPSGVIIGKDGVVKVGGTFAASTLDVDDGAFLNGGALTFSGTSKASVVNLGKVEAFGGDVVLAAAVVRNAGSIQAANGGEVGLLAGYTVTMKDQVDQNGLFSVQIGGTGTSVTNEGLIAATTAELRANGGNIYALAGDTSSLIKATQVTRQGGQIFLTAPGGTVTVASGVTLDASGVGSGSGGHILVDGGATGFHGTALAEGGRLGGDGGLVETSGGVLDFSGAKVDTLAPFGKTGTWLLDPYDLTVNAAGAAAIEAGLASNDVVVQTTASSATTAFGVANSSGSGDITIAAPISWSSGHTLTLDAYRSLHVDAPITVAGGGGVVIETGSGGDYDFGLTATGFTGSISYTGGSSSDASLTINGASYTLLYSMSDVQGINANLGGDYALATSLDASGTTYTHAVVAGPGMVLFSGIFEGLGHTIKNLTINDTSTGGYDGLFAQTSGTVRDIGLVGGSVSGAGDTVGSLVGGSWGPIINAYATGAVSGGGYVGGLVGQSFAPITNAYATGAVSGGGGGYVGGLVGLSGYHGSITNAYATGAVSGGGGGYVGGLAGWSARPITNAYATGAVNGGSGGYVGGLVGWNSGPITNAYATGAVRGGSEVGGLVGGNSGVAITNAWYDTQTTGQTSDGGGAVGLTTRQLQGLDPISGSTYFSLASNLGDNGSTWGGGSGGLYPYLKAFFPNGVQAVSGVAYQGSGGAVAASGANGAVTVGLDAGGGQIGQATTGANGYYYIVVPAGTVANGQGLVAYTTADGATGVANAASFVESATGASGFAASGLNLYGGWLVQQGGAADTTLSGLNSLYAAAIGSTAPSTFTLANREIDVAASSFTLDAPISLSGTLSLSSAGSVGQSAGLSVGALLLSGGGAFTLSNGSNQIGTIAGTTGSLALADGESLIVGSASGAEGASLSGVTSTGAVALSTAGALTLAAGVSAGSGADVTLAAGGAFINQAGASAVNVSGGGRWLIYSSAPGADVFGGLNSNNTAVWNTAAGAGVSASGNRYVFAYQPTLTVTTTSDSKPSGVDATGQIQADYTITGAQPGVAGAFLGDSAVYSGAPSLASAGAAATAAAGSYTITASLGSLTSASGYAFQFADTGVLTVKAAAPQILFEAGNLANAGLPAGNSGSGSGLLSGTGSDTTSDTTSDTQPSTGSNSTAGGAGGAGGLPTSGSTPSGSGQGQGAEGAAPYPGGLSGYGSIRFESGIQ